MVACSPGSETPDTQNNQPATIDSVLMDKMDEWVNTTQPGTAGSSQKAFLAVKDLIIWALDNAPSKETIILTVEEYMEGCEYKDEAADAFLSMKYVFEKITDGTIDDILEGIEFNIPGFETDSKICDNIRVLFSAVEEYVNKQR